MIIGFREDTIVLMESQQNNRILILGASSGIGQEVARQLINMGWTVSVAARREAPLVSLKAIEPSRVEYAVVDILAEDACARLQQLADRTGGIDIYLHAAGIGSQNRQLVLQMEEETVRTNALGFTRAMNWAYHYFEQQGKGHIAAISSIAGTKGLGPAPAYSATKAFQANYIEALEQLARQQGHDIRFTDIRPGFVDTPLLGESPAYPMLMSVADVAGSIIKSLVHEDDVKVIDWRYRMLVGLWRLLPRWVWKRMRI